MFLLSFKFYFESLKDLAHLFCAKTRKKQNIFFTLIIA